MFHVCIPVRDEAPTIGVLLWRIRKTFREFPREYQVVVYDDGSTDATAEVLKPYQEVLPLTVLGGREPRGYAAAVDALMRHVAKHARYARRDAMLLFPGDFTDDPAQFPELVKRFEGGADVVVGEHVVDAHTPLPVRRLRTAAPWILRPFVRVPGKVEDPFGTCRLLRVSVVKDVVRAAGDAPVVRGETPGIANLDLLLGAAAHTTRIERVALPVRWDVRPRATRVRAWPDGLALFRYARGARAKSAAARGPQPPASAGKPRPAAPTADASPAPAAG